MATPTNLPIAAVSGDVLTAAYVNALRGAFRVLQVVAGSTSTATAASSSSTFADTGLTATITPQSTDSKILVLVSQNGVIKSGNTSVGLRLLRGITALSTFSASLGRTDTAAVNVVAGSVAYLDSPAAITAQTYKTQYASQQNIAEVYCQFGGAMSTIILMEISA